MDSKQDMCKCGHPRSVHTWWSRLGQCAIDGCVCYEFIPEFISIQPKKLTKREIEILETGWD